MARIKFTAGRIRDFDCPADRQQAYFWDSEAPGLGIRATAGSKVYIFQGRLASSDGKGKEIRVKIGDVLTWPIETGDDANPGAREKARRMALLLKQGIDPRHDDQERIAANEAKQAKAKRHDVLVADAWAAYLAHHERRWGARHMADHINLSQAGGEKKKRGKGETVQGVLHPLLQLRMKDITADVLTAWQAKEAETRANNARQGFEMFRAFWRWCASRTEYAGTIDTAAVEDRDVRAEVPTRKSKRFDVLQRAHLPAWFAAVRGLGNPVISAYLQGLLLTGARREELAGLKWADVDFRWGSMWVKDKVAEEGRKIPLTPYLSSLVAALPRRNEWVFSSPAAADGRIAEPRIPHNRALAVAGLEHVTLHGLRRTFASLAEWVEIPTGVVAQIMGHAPNATAERHYINRPLELLAVWHTKYESWILEQAGIELPKEGAAPSLRVVSSNTAA